LTHQSSWPAFDLHQDRWIDFSANCFSMLVQVEFDPSSSSNTVRGWLHVQNGGSSGQGQGSASATSTPTNGS
jgi:hypothetical protein